MDENIAFPDKKTSLDSDSTQIARRKIVEIRIIQIEICYILHFNNLISHFHEVLAKNLTTFPTFCNFSTCRRELKILRKK